MSPPEHASKARLLDYYLGDPSTEEAGTDDTLEEHLFECASCSASLDAIHRAGAAVVLAVRRGEVGSGGTTALLNRMSRDRLNVRHYTIEPGEIIPCTIGKDDDFMAGRFVLPEGDFERIDLRVLDASEQELVRVDDIVIDARAGHAIVFIPGRPVQDEDSGTTHYVLVVPEQEGDREIARYSLAHTAMRSA